MTQKPPLTRENNKPIQTAQIPANYRPNTPLADQITLAPFTPPKDPHQSWAILPPEVQKIKTQVEQQGTPLKDWDIQIFRGVITGCNEAFIIDRKKRDELIAADVNSSAIIKPILRGKDIKRYQVNFADWYVIIAKFGSYKTLKSEYPAIYQHLKSYEQKLKSRGQCRYTRSGKIVGDYPGQHHWLELDNNPKQEYLDIFTKPKIIYPSMTQYLPFYYDGDGAFFINDKAFILSGDKEILPYLTALLNSSLFRCCFKENFAALGEKGRELRKIFIEKIPLKKPTPAQADLFAKLVPLAQLARQQTPELAPALETLIDTLITESHFPQKTPTLQTTTTKLLQNHHPTDSKAKKINHLKTLTQATQTHPLKTQITQTQSKIKKTSKT